MNKHRNSLPRFLIVCLAVICLNNESFGQLVGNASYYADKYHGVRTANGETYNKYNYTAAHRTLPFGTRIKVVRVDNGRSVVVRVNDRGPNSPSRIIDLSRAAAEQLDMINDGIVKVELELLAEGSDVAYDPASSPAYQDKTEIIDRNPKSNVDLTKLPVRDHNGNLLSDKNNPVNDRPVYEDRPINNTPSKPAISPDVAKYTPAIFQMNASKFEFQGYGVQIGAFFSYYRLLEGLDKLSQKGFTSTLVQNGVKDGKPIFRILIGPYKTRSEANEIRKQAAKKGEKGIVIDLATFQ